MNELKHTPGPWVRDRNSNLVGANGRKVTVWGAGFFHGQRTSETEANGVLMEAAPELLEACNTALSQIDKALHGDVGGYDPLGTARMLRAAIAKATAGA